MSEAKRGGADAGLAELIRRADELMPQAPGLGAGVPGARNGGAGGGRGAVPGGMVAGGPVDVDSMETGSTDTGSTDTGSVEVVAAGSEPSGSGPAGDEAESGPKPWQPVVRRWYLPGSVATAALLAGTVLRLGMHWSTLPVLVFASTAVLLAVVDFAVLRLPNALVYPTALGVAVTAAAQAVAEHRPRLLLTETAGAVAVAAFYLLLFVLSRGGLGMGDVKVGVVAGFLLAARGWQQVLSGTFLAYVLTLLVAIGYLVRRRKVFPYGPGLLAGTFLVLLLQ